MAWAYLEGWFRVQSPEESVAVSRLVILNLRVEFENLGFEITSLETVSSFLFEIGL